MRSVTPDSLTRDCSALLALEGGEPIRTQPLPYTRHDLTPDDAAAVARALASGWLTTGPEVAAFEEALARRCGVQYAVAVSSGTAALHAALHTLGLQPGDEVIVPTLTFVATAAAVCYCGATPVFADIDARTLLIDPRHAESLITPRTRAIVAVDYAGQPCDYAALAALGTRHGLAIVADACHSLGGAREGKPVGSLATATALSFHPAKHVAAGEGGAITTNDADLARRLRRFRHHGIEWPAGESAAAQPWRYEVVELGHNLRLSDLHAALARSQLARLQESVRRRQALAAAYDAAFSKLSYLEPLAAEPFTGHARHLYVARCRTNRDFLLRALRAEGIGAQVHYGPAHLQPFYQQAFGGRAGQCPQAEQAAAEIISLPLFPGMTDADQQDVLRAIDKIQRHGADAA